MEHPPLLAQPGQDAAYFTSSSQLPMAKISLLLVFYLTAKFVQVSNFFHEPIYFPGLSGYFLLGDFWVLSKVQIRKPPRRPPRSQQEAPGSQGKKSVHLKNYLMLKSWLCYASPVKLTFFNCSFPSFPSFSKASSSLLNNNSVAPIHFSKK